TIEKRLSSWKNRYVSLGGRVSVLSSIPVFYLSFLKLPSKARKAIVRIQRNFLWGGAAGVRDKIPWVSWKDVCRPKCEGGLGVRDLKWFNMSLLAKWRWRLLGEDDLLWKKVLDARYGDVARPILTIGRGNNFSLWWKDLVGLGVERGLVGDWTHDVFIKKLGNGGSTRFWLDHWIGVAPLKEVFPRLYNISLQMDFTIQQMGEWVNDK
ncbi:ribonuclease H protein, partial [Trifolium medium]|nr:ribonuclease H protein [Trifolium medium]